MGELTNIAAGDRTLQAYLAHSESSQTQSGAGLILLQEWWGLVDHIKDVADRLAQEGFSVLAPDLYDGAATDSPDEAGRRMMALDIDRASTSVSAATTALLTRESVSKVGVLGFCMGGQLALYAACQQQSALSAVVDYYGVHPLVEPNIKGLRCPVLAHFGKHDSFVPEDVAHSLLQSIETHGGHVEAHFYDAGHAFFNDSRPEAYNESAAQLSWDRTVAFLRHHLQG